MEVLNELLEFFVASSSYFDPVVAAFVAAVADHTSSVGQVVPFVAEDIAVVDPVAAAVAYTRPDHPSPFHSSEHLCYYTCHYSAVIPLLEHVSSLDHI